LIRDGVDVLRQFMTVVFPAQLDGCLCVSNWEFWRRIQDSATLCGTRRLAYADSRMRSFLLTLVHLAVTTAKLCGPGGVRAVIAENLLLKQQLIVLGVVAGGRPP